MARLPPLFDAVPKWVDGDTSTCGAIEPIDDPVAIIPLNTTNPNGTYVKTIQIFPVLPPDSLYFGTQALTKSGLVCENWKTALSNPEDYGMFEFPGLKPADVDDDDRLESNFCRNPDGRDSAW
jgi:hypothetical protein